MTDDRSDERRRLIAALLGPAEPELTCEECFERLDHYVELTVAGADPDEAVAGNARAPGRLPGVRGGSRQPARVRQARGRRGAARGLSAVGGIARGPYALPTFAEKDRTRSVRTLTITPSPMPAALPPTFATASIVPRPSASRMVMSPVA